MRTCGSCGREVEDDFRFCPQCGSPQRLKVVEHFLGDSRLDDGGLRVSAYLSSPQHVRFSIWHGDRPQAAMSLPMAEAARLADFLQRLRPVSHQHLAESVRRSAQVVQRVLADAIQKTP